MHLQLKFLQPEGTNNFGKKHGIVLFWYIIGFTVVFPPLFYCCISWDLPPWNCFTHGKTIQKGGKSQGATSGFSHPMSTPD